MPLKRPRLRKREEAAAPTSYAPPPSTQPYSAPETPKQAASSRGITPRELQAALGGAYSAPAAGGSGRGITTRDLGYALSEGTSSERSVASHRVTSYPGDQDMNALPVKAGTRTGPRVTSYRIPIRRAAHSNVYDTIT